MIEVRIHGNGVAFSTNILNTYDVILRNDAAKDAGEPHLFRDGAPGNSQSLRFFLWDHKVVKL